MKAAPWDNNQEIALLEWSALQFTNELVVLSTGIDRIEFGTYSLASRHEEHVRLLEAAFSMGSLGVDCRELSRSILARGFDWENTR